MSSNYYLWLDFNAEMLSNLKQCWQDSPLPFWMKMSLDLINHDDNVCLRFFVQVRPSESCARSMPIRVDTQS